MRKILCVAILAACGVTGVAQSQEQTLLDLKVEARLDYQRDWLDGDIVKDNTGFEGKFLNIRADGNITDNLSYSWRQRLNKQHADRTFFDATDWIYLNYNVGRWSIAGGKQVVTIGGWEYDRAPIDLYGCSVFWNNIPCYQIGASAAYHINQGNKISFQFCESPFFTPENRDLYAYNLMWQGDFKNFQTLYSVNLIEYEPGRYINYIALGNKITTGNVSLEFDFMNRASSHQVFFLKDCSLMGELSYRPDDRWKLHAKMTYDVNHSHNLADKCVLNGTELTMAGAGAEFFPLRSKDHTLRLHANIYYSWGKNANEADVMQNKSTLFDLGVKWSMNLLSFKR